MVKGKATEAIQGAIGGKLPGGLPGTGGTSGSSGPTGGSGGGTQPADQKKSGPLPLNPGGLFGR
jgi:AsmA protein